MIQPWVLKKRYIGIAIVCAALAAAAGIVLLDVLRGHSMGPSQVLAVIGCGAAVVFGASLAAFGVDNAVLPAESTSRSLTILWLRRSVLGIAIAIMAFHLLVFVVYAASLASFPFDYDQGEGFELNDTVLLSQLQSPYRDNAVYPFYASNYPPLYHVMLVPFVWLFGPQYWYGRLAGMAATLITAGAIGFAVHRATRDRAVAVVSGLAFVASNYIYHVGPLFRQHMMMVMFETLAVVVIAGIDFTADRHWRRKLLIGLVLLLAAGFTKQLAITTVAAVFVYLFLNFPRRAIAWGAIFAAIAGAIFVLLNVVTHGQWWLNIITANVNEYILSQFKGLLGQFIGLHGALLIMAVLYALYEIYFDRISLYTIWFAASAVDGVLAGKWGAGDSYFATMIAAMCILAGLFVGRQQWRLPSLQRYFPLIGVVGCTLFILYGLAVVHMPLDGPLFGTLAQVLNIKARADNKFPTFYDSAGWTMGYATIGQLPTADDVANGWRIVNAVKDDPRPIMSEEAAFSFRTGRPVVTNPTQLRNLYLNGHYDPASLVKMINDQAFGAVIYRAGFYPEPVLAAVKQSYTGAQQIDMNGYQYTILLPNAAVGK